MRIYTLDRWHGDPATTRPSQSRNNNNTNNNQGPVDDTEADDDHPSQPPPPQTHHQQQQSHQAPTQPQPPPQPQQQQQQNNTTGLDFTTDPTSTITNGMNGFTPHLNYINPQTLRDSLVPPSPATVPTGPSTTHHTVTGPPTSASAVNGAASSSSTSSSHPHIPNVPHHTGSHTAVNPNPAPSSSTPSSAPNSSIPSGGPNDPPVVNVTITQSMLSTYLQFLQVQTQTGKMKLEYLRRREEREEKESVQRREMERMKLEREAAEFEHNKHSATTKQKADRAIVSQQYHPSLFLSSRLLPIGTTQQPFNRRLG